MEFGSRGLTDKAFCGIVSYCVNFIDTARSFWHIPALGQKGYLKMKTLPLLVALMVALILGTFAPGLAVVATNQINLARETASGVFSPLPTDASGVPQCVVGDVIGLWLTNSTGLQQQWLTAPKNGGINLSGTVKKWVPAKAGLVDVYCVANTAGTVPTTFAVSKRVNVLVGVPRLDVVTTTEDAGNKVAYYSKVKNNGSVVARGVKYRLRAVASGYESVARSDEGAWAQFSLGQLDKDLYVPGVMLLKAGAATWIQGVVNPFNGELDLGTIPVGQTGMVKFYMLKNVNKPNILMEGEIFGDNDPNPAKPHVLNVDLWNRQNGSVAKDCTLTLTLGSQSIYMIIKTPSGNAGNPDIVVAAARIYRIDKETWWLSTQINGTWTTEVKSGATSQVFPVGNLIGDSTGGHSKTVSVQLAF